MAGLLIAIVAIGVLAAGIIIFTNPLGQIQKASDARRKSDLSQVQKALELFRGDNGRYPEADNYRIKGLDGNLVEWGNPWLPYMANLPKDPNPSRNYVYVVSFGNQAYYVYASLDNGSSDPQACAAGAVCANAGSASCGSGTICNYGVSSQNVSP
jgi:general secretion pathway protein G